MPQSPVLPQATVEEALTAAGAPERFHDRLKAPDRDRAVVVADGVVHADADAWEGFRLPTGLCPAAARGTASATVTPGQTEGWCGMCLPYLWGSGRQVGLPALRFEEAVLLAALLHDRAGRDGLGGYELLVASRLFDVLWRRWRDDPHAGGLARWLQPALRRGQPALGSTASVAAATEIVEGWAMRKRTAELLWPAPGSRPPGSPPTALWGVVFTRTGISASPNTELGEFPATSAAVLLGTGSRYEGQAVLPIDEAVVQLVRVVPTLLENHRANGPGTFSKIGVSSYSAVTRTNEPFSVDACRSAAALWTPEHGGHPLADLETAWRLGVLHAATGSPSGRVGRVSF